METFNKFVYMFLSLISLSFTILTFLNFTKFISDFSTPIINGTFNVEMDPSFADTNSTLSYVTRASIVDVALLCIFMAQHSSLLPFQDLVASQIQTQMLDRSLLNIFTCVSLQLLIHFWKPIPQHIFWAVNTDEQYRLLIFKGIHIISWVLIYVLMIPMDITDFLGVKQVYYSLTGRPAPSELKSGNLKHLHQKMRHPSFLCFATIFWIHPYMRLDRFLLAALWTGYMLVVWRPDATDYKYVVQQQKNKHLQFSQKDTADSPGVERPWKH